VKKHIFGVIPEDAEELNLFQEQDDEKDDVQECEVSTAKKSEIRRIKKNGIFS
jgi:hypothetical protein